MHPVVFYRTSKGTEPVKELIAELNTQASTNKHIRVRVKKIIEHIEILQAYGTNKGLPHMRHIDDGIWELRPTSDRIFFFCYMEECFVLLHHFQKKTQKTPPREIEQAKRYRKDFIERSHYHE